MLMSINTADTTGLTILQISARSLKGNVAVVKTDRNLIKTASYF